MINTISLFKKLSPELFNNGTAATIKLGILEIKEVQLEKINILLLPSQVQKSRMPKKKRDIRFQKHIDMQYCRASKNQSIRNLCNFLTLCVNVFNQTRYYIDILTLSNRDQHLSNHPKRLATLVQKNQNLAVLLTIVR